jgi:hypothetical protein
LSVLEGKFNEGDRVLVTRAPGEGGQLVFERAEPAAAESAAGSRGGNGRKAGRGS